MNEEEYTLVIHKLTALTIALTIASRNGEVFDIDMIDDYAAGKVGVPVETSIETEGDRQVIKFYLPTEGKTVVINTAKDSIMLERRKGSKHEEESKNTNYATTTTKSIGTITIGLN